MPLLAFQGLVVSYLVRRLGRLRPTVARLLAVLWAGVAVVAAGMWLLGPWVMRTFYGPAYDVDGVFMALVTVGAGCTATLVVAALYGYVVTNTRYVALEFGIHGYKPYRVDRMLTTLRLAGVFARAAAVLVGGRQPERRVGGVALDRARDVGGHRDPAVGGCGRPGQRAAGERHLQPADQR